MADQTRTYAIGKPTDHQTLSFFKKAEAGPPEAFREFVTEAGFPGGVEKRAIWVVHGMGQQVPFETLDALAQGIINAAGHSHPNGWQISLPPRVATAKFTSAENPSETQVVQRVEIDFQKPAPHSAQLQLHLYEAYWAPLTEGVANVSDVLSFLYDGALHGILNCIKPFRRAMFPDDTSPVITPPPKEGKCKEGVWNFRIPKRAAIEISTLMALVFSLGAINTVILAASAAKLKFPIFGSWPVSWNWDQLTAIATAVTAMAITLGAVLFLAEMSKPAETSTATKWVILCLTWIAIALAAFSILGAAVLMALISRFAGVALWFRSGMRYHAIQFVSTSGILLAVGLCAIASLRRAAQRAKGKDHRSGGWPLFLFLLGYLLHIGLLCLLVLIHYVRFFDPKNLPHWQQLAVAFLGSPFWVWPALLYISKLVADIIVEYPGDVAIYIAPNKLDRFNEARRQIKQLALDSLMPLYSSLGASPEEWQYSKVALVGHSLGSVIAYDTLNKLLTLDDLLGHQFQVDGRTCILETFGSPLDKTAFFFSYQGTENFNIREQLAASVQPLIQSYKCYRGFPWINVYSRSDIISGFLKFYDVNPPASACPPAAHPVSNIPDPDAIVPLVAHVDYWKNRAVWNKLLKMVTA